MIQPRSPQSGDFPLPLPSCHCNSRGRSQFYDEGRHGMGGDRQALAGAHHPPRANSLRPGVARRRGRVLFRDRARVKSRTRSRDTPVVTRRRSPDWAVTWPGPLGQRRLAGHGRLPALALAAAGGSVRWACHGPVALAPVHPDLRLALHHLPAQLPIQVPRPIGRAVGLLRSRRGFPALP